MSSTSRYQFGAGVSVRFHSLEQCVGYDSSDPVSHDYGMESSFTGGTISKVVFDVADGAYVDVHGICKLHWRAIKTSSKNERPNKTR